MQELHFVFSVEAYVQDVMLSQTEVSYYAYNADGTLGKQLRTAAVTDRKLIYLEKGGEVAGLAPDGVLEEWEYYYLTKPELDVDMDAVALARYGSLCFRGFRGDPVFGRAE